MMSDQRRFKQKRDFKTRLGEQPEERDLPGDRNFGKGKFARDDRRFTRRDGDRREDRFGDCRDRKFGREDGRFGRDGRKFEHNDGDRRGGRFERPDRPFSRRDGGDRSFKQRGGDRPQGRGYADRRNNKPFNKFHKDDED